jgi:hypothetical protein
VCKRTDDDLLALVQKLSRGRYRKGGQTLTREECFSLWEILIGQRRLPRRRGPKVDPELVLRPEAIATLVALYETTGMKTEAAVARVCECYGVSRSQVFDAMRRHPMPKKTSQAYGSDLGLRQLINLYEALWSK